MSPESLARELNIDAKRLRDWLRKTYPRPESMKGSAWSLTREQVDAARARWGAGRRSRGDAPAGSQAQAPRSPAVQTPRAKDRTLSDEAYVIGLCDAVLDEQARRQHRFPWLLGDPSVHGARANLPVDAYYERHRLVVEYRERQHFEATPFFDRRETVSGIGRGEQRRLYDRRREEEIPKHGLRLLVIRVDQLRADGRGRLLRDERRDRAVLEAMLEELGMR